MMLVALGCLGMLPAICQLQLHPGFIALLQLCRKGVALPFPLLPPGIDQCIHLLHHLSHFLVVVHTAITVLVELLLLPLLSV